MKYGNFGLSFMLSLNNSTWKVRSVSDGYRSPLSLPAPVVLFSLIDLFTV